MYSFWRCAVDRTMSGDVDGAGAEGDELRVVLGNRPALLWAGRGRGRGVAVGGGGGGAVDGKWRAWGIRRRLSAAVVPRTESRSLLTVDVARTPSISRTFSRT